MPEPTRYAEWLASEGLANDEVIARAELASLPDANTRRRERLAGLALSGGGIRSATFALGLVQALAANHWLTRFDYVSSVSGGGYCAGFLHALIRRLRANIERQLDGESPLLSPTERRRRAAAAALSEAERTLGDTRAAEPGEIQHLRQYSNYLIPRKALSSGDFVGTIGAFARNTALILTPLTALFAALSLGPLLAYWFSEQVADARIADIAGYDAILVMAATLAVLALALVLANVAKVISPPKSENTEADAPAATTRSSFFSRICRWLERHWRSLIYASLFLACWLFSIYAVGAVRGNNSLANRVFPAIAVLYAAVWIAVFLYALAHGHIGRRAAILGVIAACTGATVGALGLYATAEFAHVLVGPGGAAQFWLAYLLLPVCATLAVLLAGVFNVGLLGVASDFALESRYRLAREYWARIGGRVLFLMLGVWLLPQVLVVLGPWLLAQLDIAGWIDGGWMGLIGWLITTAGAVGAAQSSRTSGEKRTLLELLAKIGPYVFVGGLFVFVSMGLQALLTKLTGAPVQSDSSLARYLQDLALLATGESRSIVTVIGVALAIWLLPAALVDIGEFSLHAIYRNRLVRAYLGAARAEHRNPDPVGDFDPEDDFPIAELARQRPYPLINTAINLSEASVQLDWQDRKAASFVFGPSVCGHLGTHVSRGRMGDAREAPEREVSKLAQQVGLGQAVAISGAAVNPNMGYHTSPATAFLLTLFNVRLGDWVANFAATAPSSLRRRIQDRYGRPLFPGSFLLGELIGNTRAHFPFVHLSDGGHFENLALYELVRRRCRMILCSDAGQDGTRQFADLANALRKCRTDFGAEIELDVDAMRASPSAAAFQIGRILYRGNGEPTEGLLVYVKPTLVEDLPPDVSNYAALNSDFPHQSTGDQFFDDAQFESYRQLGLAIGQRLLTQHAADMNKALAP
jgi:hypothetical protein